jgi:uncharacterized protein YggE
MVMIRRNVKRRPGPPKSVKLLKEKDKMTEPAHHEHSRNREDRQVGARFRGLRAAVPVGAGRFFRGRFVAVPALVAVLAATGGWQGAQAAETGVRQPSMTVLGRAEVSVAPDLVRVAIGVGTEAKTAAEALTQNSSLVSGIISEAESLGIDKRKIATSRLLVQPVIAQRKSSARDVPEVVGYGVTNTITIEISPVGKAGQVIDRLVARGANRIDSITFDVSDAEERRDGTRTAAVKAARAKAELLAGAAGVRLGRVLDIREAGASEPVPRTRLAMRAAAAVPIEGGEAVLESQVEVTFEILEGSAP